MDQRRQQLREAPGERQTDGESRADDVGAAFIPGGELGERRALAAHVFEIGGRDALAIVGRIGNALEEHHEAVEMRQGYGFPKQGVAHAENGGSGADAEREREHGGGSEAGRFAQHTFGVTNVPPQIHGVTALEDNTRESWRGFGNTCMPVCTMRDTHVTRSRIAP
jgi:hypothetical protein